MKLTAYFRFILVAIVGLLWSCQQVPTGSAVSETAAAPATTIYVVRHAEKDTLNPTDRDPVLTAAGEARALELVKYLNGTPVNALYSTNYKRTKATLQPLAEHHKLEVMTYEPRELEALKTQLLQNYTGKTIVVAGHSNTILAIVEAFGLPKPVAEVPESKYDHIFKITISPDQAAVIVADTYGAPTK